MKFDVVIGNPPYQMPTGSKKLWPLFIKRGLQLVKDGGIVYLVTPTTWLNRKGRGAWQFMRDFDVVSLRANLCPWFPSVGTNPGAALIFKRPYGGQTLVDGEMSVDLHHDVLPVDHKNLNHETTDFLTKMSRHHMPVSSVSGDGPGWGDPSLSEEESETHKYETYYASSAKRRSVWSSEPRAGCGELKLVVGRYGNTKKTCEITRKGVGIMARYVTGSREELERLRDLITHPANIKWTALMASDAWTDPLYWISENPV
jgi:hypothetical protein